MRKLPMIWLLSATLAGAVPGHAQETAPAPPAATADDKGKASQAYEDFTPTEEISEDLSVAFPTDI